MNDDFKILLSEKSKEIELLQKELKLEEALERVRAASMRMPKSDDMMDVVNVFFEQIKSTGINAASSWVVLTNLKNDTLEYWIRHEEEESEATIVHVNDNIIFKEILESSIDRVETLTDVVPKTVFIPIINQFFDHSVPDRAGRENFHLLQILHKYGYMGLGTWDEVNNYERDVCRRFTKVFEQTYTRFLDLQKAEAQARESQIQLALERVRARTMAMHSAEELASVSSVVYIELNRLGITNFQSCGFHIIDEPNEIQEVWNFHIDHKQLTRFQMPLKGNDILEIRYQAWKKGEKLFHQKVGGQQLNDNLEYITSKEIKLGKASSWIEKYGFPDPVHFHFENFSKGYLHVISEQELSEEHRTILGRFAKVFEQTYTRFLDLQKAEAQAKEAEIELALERVRARTMAMQKSNELSEVAALLFKQLKMLGADLWTAVIAFCKEDELLVEKWGGSPITDQMFDPLFIPYNADHGEQSMYDTWKNKVELYSYIQDGKELKDIYDHLMTIPSFKASFQKVIDAGRPLPVWQKNHVASYKYGYLLIVTEEEFEEEYVFTRFAKVFEQTYTRFLDLQKAEAQTKEAQIEAALERVRSRTMAMQKSEELSETSFLLDCQIRTLGIKTWGCAFNIYRENDSMEWFGNAAGVLPTYIIPRVGIFKKYYDKGQKGESFYVQEIAGEECIAHYEFMSNLPVIGKTLKQLKESNGSFPSYQIDHVAYIKYGYLLFITIEPVPEAHDIFKRFAKVFEQTYTRFLDLQKAEAQAKEAIKQASLERVRGEIASMRSTSDLQRITPLVWNELKTLKVPFIRCGVFIVNEQMEHVVVHLSSSEGQALGVLDLAFESNELTTKAIRSWRLDEVYHQHWNQEEFLNWTKLMIKAGQVKSKKTYQGMENAPESLDLHFIPFTQGMLYVGSVEPLEKDEINLVKSLADSFAIAYARYEDFVKLEKAKESIELTLNELKTTQKQLIQSEKMASLGELTAGIAHEIQNPLNFVNNFSEVSEEMIQEIKEERLKTKDERDEALEDEILSDIEQNLLKINHHGNRASSIVKGMLEHSRTSSGKKELTDINALADEYLRLAYHGLRAKDKGFNADFKTDFDPTLPKIQVIPQDIGRVLLNLINNAFQATSDEALKRKLHSSDNEASYKPTVTVKTSLKPKTEGSKQIAIAISDNGPGIPNEIKDKIFQPFFTTKDAGKGTGLGLSLAYDIIKAHGGNLTVESEEGKGSTFLINLLA